MWRHLAEDNIPCVYSGPAKMRERGITPADVVQAIQSQNMEVSAGSVGARPSSSKRSSPIRSPQRAACRRPNSSATLSCARAMTAGLLHLSDIARIDLGSNSNSQIARVNGRETAMIGISQLPGANALKVAKGLRRPSSMNLPSTFRPVSTIR